jgi:hypothetical protein
VYIAGKTCPSYHWPGTPHPEYYSNTPARVSTGHCCPHCHHTDKCCQHRLVIVCTHRRFERNSNHSTSGGPYTLPAHMMTRHPLLSEPLYCLLLSLTSARLCTEMYTPKRPPKQPNTIGPHSIAPTTHGKNQPDSLVLPSAVVIRPHSIPGEDAHFYRRGTTHTAQPHVDTAPQVQPPYPHRNTPTTHRHLAVDVHAAQPRATAIDCVFA